MASRPTALLRFASLLWAVIGVAAFAQQIDWPSPRVPRPKMAAIGPYNALFIAGADGIVERAQGYRDGETLPPASDWTMSAWIRPERRSAGRAIVGGMGPAGGPSSLALTLVDGRPGFLSGAVALAAAGPSLALHRWHHVAVVRQGGDLRLLVDGRPAAQARAPEARPIPSLVTIGPRALGQPAFTGKVAALTWTPAALGAPALAEAARRAPDDDLIVFEDASPSWPLQTRTQYGEAVPQAAWTLPKSNAPFGRPIAIPAPDRPAIERRGDGRYTINGWRLIEAPRAPAGGAALSLPGHDVSLWYVATVPGTVLTTLVDRGVYPDPRFGLNNMAIPERLARQDYWYRSEFALPAEPAGKRYELLFDGINYAAEVWVNGGRVGTITGAFVRGRFDVTALLRPGANAVAVRVSPPPHPGIPHEQSMTAGRGENGGAMQSDGPTFHASEGWDWIPAIRDRNTGLWQGVSLLATDALALGDPRVVTAVPKADLSVAEVEIAVPVTNHGTAPAVATVAAAFDDVAVSQTVTVPAGGSVTVAMQPSRHAALRIAHPRLWWPNGYGEPTLHRLHLSVAAGGRVSDVRDLDFGMRQVTYELSSLDSAGDLRRIEVDTTRARQLGTPIIDERHAALRKVAGGWANTLVPRAERSPAVRAAVSDPRLSPHLVLKVNGVAIAARGGNWGMDEIMKRVERSRLEPYFRLHRDAGMNIIRNWMGQSTEEAFFALADRYGIMVIDDFWESTQDNDAEAQDVALFLANARDTVRRFRNHPSIVLWIGRNEGVPQPILQAALQDLIWEEDGTRLYKGNSRLINLAGSGPYDWQPPERYFTDYAKGFAVEVGTASFPTREAWLRTVPHADLWPANDAWAYHDWHQERAVAVTSFTEAMDARLGPAGDFADFERKAQLLNYESHRAIFESFNAGLWTTNSGRMLWMTHPAWPSADFQIYSSDYDTHASYYGTKKGAEPIHVQMNPDRRVLMVNTTRRALAGVTVRVRAVTVDGRAISAAEQVLDVPTNGTATAMTVDVGQAAAHAPVFVRLEAVDAAGARIADNFYWHADDPAALRGLGTMPAASVTARVADAAGAQDERALDVTLSNDGTTPALQVKLTLFDRSGAQILPAYFDDNYVALLPGETRRITVRYPARLGSASVRMRGWNVAERSLP